MTPDQLAEAFEKSDKISPAALIEYQGEKGIAIRLGENLASNWLSYEIIVFWEDGDHTILPDEFELLKLDLWDFERYSDE